MSTLQQLARTLHPRLSSARTLRPRPASRRFQSTNPPPPPPPNDSRARTAASKLLDRVPKRLRKYTDRLRDAPVSHVVAFLVLHEITAIVPLFGLAGLFHWSGWIPSSVADSEVLSQGVERFTKYFRRKGWFGVGHGGDDGELRGADVLDIGGAGTVLTGGMATTEGMTAPVSGQRIIVEFATAYALTKALLPVRLVACAWATPWFARAVVGRVSALVERVSRRTRVITKK